jgi:hypothetical protein
MFYRLKDRVRRIRFAGECKGVLQSAPVTLDPSSSLALLSQLQHKDVLMYLLAVKSFARQIRPGAVYVVDDGSLSADDRDVLRDHVPRLTVFDLPALRSSACPSGGTWERLLAISTLVDDHYVIQLDSDTLTLGAIDDVRLCIGNERAFALGTWDNQRIETMRERSETAKSRGLERSDHVQVVAEANFDRLADFGSLRYVRGCSGFAGFARKSFTRTFVESISVQMEAAIGERWREWGSEQVMSNIVLAYIPNSVVLPHPKYADCQKMRPGVTQFVHFIGGCRFDGGTYARLGAQVIGTLPRSG